MALILCIAERGVRHGIHVTDNFEARGSQRTHYGNDSITRAPSAVTPFQYLRKQRKS